MRTPARRAVSIWAPTPSCRHFGPEIPSPFGNIPPVRANARLDLGYTGGELVIAIHGGLELFRIPVGDAYLIIHSNSGVQFGAGVGIGLPSYRNNENDPFYLGLRVDGWVSRGRFQFEGKGKFALFSLKLLEGDGLINDRGIGACWTVLGIPGGAFYKWGLRYDVRDDVRAGQLPRAVPRGRGRVGRPGRGRSGSPSPRPCWP